jgi:hypothetical protein
MSDEIKKAQAEAQQMAKELGIYEMVRNIVTNGSKHSQASESKWGNCLIKYRVRDDNAASFVDAVASIFEEVSSPDERTVTSLTMPNGTILYRSYETKVGGQIISDFRYGSWVEKLKADSEKITAEKRRAEAEKAEQEKRAKLSPFSAISDDEFEDAMSLDKDLPF